MGGGQGANNEHILLQWNDHNRIFFKECFNLLDGGDLTDVTLICGKNAEIFHAHKLVLSVCSAFFNKLFKRHPSLTKQNNSVIYLKDVEAKHLKALLNFMYLGEIRINEDDLQDLLNTAQGLDVKGLTESDNSSADSAPHRTSSSSSSSKNASGSVSAHVQEAKPSTSRSHSHSQGASVVSTPVKRKHSDYDKPSTSSASFERGDMPEAKVVKTEELDLPPEESLGWEEDSTSGHGAGFDTTGADHPDDGGADFDDSAADFDFSAGGDEAAEGQDPNNSRATKYFDYNSLPPLTYDSTSNEQRPQCNICGKQSYSKSDLKRHLRTHGGVKPYECRNGVPGCEKRFNDTGTRNRHERSCARLHPSIQIQVAENQAQGLGVHFLNQGLNTPITKGH